MMKSKLATHSRASSLFTITGLALACVATVMACSSSDDDSATDELDTTPSAEAGTDSGSKKDASTNSGNDAGTKDATTDTGTDAGTADAAGDADSGPTKFCDGHATATFCDDFDNAGALTEGTTKWDFVEPSTQPVLTLSAAHAVSAPNGLLAQIIDATTPGAKFVKTVTKADFTEATWEYDVYFENTGGSDGFFLDDFQFTDAVGADTFGVRLVLFSNAGAPDRIGVEHNRQANNGAYVIEPVLPTGTAKSGQWQHIKQHVKFTFATGANKFDYDLTVDNAATPTFAAQYPGITREQAAFVRFAGMANVFNKNNSSGLKVYFDNHVVEVK